VEKNKLILFVGETCFGITGDTFGVAKTVIIGDPFATSAEITENQRKSVGTRPESDQGGV